MFEASTADIASGLYAIKFNDDTRMPQRKNILDEVQSCPAS